MRAPASPTSPGGGFNQEGLARERTEMAWTRTALAYGAAAGFAVRAAVVTHHWAGYATAALLVAVAIVAAVHGARWYAHGSQRPAPEERRSALVALSAATVVTGVAALALALSG